MIKADIRIGGALLNRKNVESIINIEREALLAGIGKEGVNIMRDNMNHRDDTGNTKKSITWRTQQQQGEENVRTLIDGTTVQYGLPDVDSEDKVYIGTTDPVARFIEDGTSPPRTSKDADLFVLSIQEWAARNGIPQDDVPAIVRYISKKGTAAHQFVDQSAIDIEEFAKALGTKFAISVTKALNS